jgi:hypothetical protein
VKGILAIVDDIEGGDQPFAVPGTSVRDAQGADTANCKPGRLLMWPRVLTCSEQML